MESSRRRRLRVVIAVASVFGLAGVAGVAGAQQIAPEVGFLRLEELEKLALEKNPTVAQADALVGSVRGRQRQTERYPNPIVGYSAENLAARQPGRATHSFWAQQTIITGSKRKHVAAAVAQERVHAEAEREMQRQRVVNAVRVLYYEILGAARLVEIRRELAALASEAVDISEELFNVGQADRPDVLEVSVEARRAEAELRRAEHDLQRAWEELAAMIGEPERPFTPLAGDLEAELPRVDEAAVRERLLGSGHELTIARARLDHARASLARARADRVPNFFVRGGAGYNFDRTESGREIGSEFFFEIGVPLPLWDRNEGTIAQAESQVRLAEAEVRRTELALRTRLAGVLRAYRDAMRTAEGYRTRVLADAQQAYQLQLARFREMAAAYPQVLIARRNLGQVRAEYVRSLVDAWQGATLLEGLLVTGGLDSPEAVPGEPPVTLETVPFTTTP